MNERTAGITRRLFLQRVSAAAAAGVVLPIGCFEQEPRPAGVTAAVPAADGELACTDVSGLTEQQVQTRKALKYVDKSPEAGKRCDGCQFFVKPEKAETCGSCKVIPGPIHPQGYCTAWAAVTG